jgi:hypothetical protein
MPIPSQLIERVARTLNDIVQKERPEKRPNPRPFKCPSKAFGKDFVIRGQREIDAKSRFKRNISRNDDLPIFFETSPLLAFASLSGKAPTMNSSE